MWKMKMTSFFSSNPRRIDFNPFIKETGNYRFGNYCGNQTCKHLETHIFELPNASFHTGNTSRPRVWQAPVASTPTSRSACDGCASHAKGKYKNTLFNSACFVVLQESLVLGLGRSQKSTPILLLLAMISHFPVGVEWQDFPDFCFQRTGSSWWCTANLCSLWKAWSARRSSTPPVSKLWRRRRTQRRGHTTRALSRASRNWRSWTTGWRCAAASTAWYVFSASCVQHLETAKYKATGRNGIEGVGQNEVKINSLFFRCKFYLLPGGEICPEEFASCSLNLPLITGNVCVLKIILLAQSCSLL